MGKFPGRVSRNWRGLLVGGGGGGGVSLTSFEAIQESFIYPLFHQISVTNFNSYSAF